MLILLSRVLLYTYTQATEWLESLQQTGNSSNKTIDIYVVAKRETAKSYK